MRKETVNTFINGINLDANALIVDNKTLVDALNATTITFNGNEHVLQNDMGNGRIHNARLKPGFVPVGLKEYGGIVYIASHNPFSGECELGSFPSPEKNLNYNNSTSTSEVNIKNLIQNSNCEGIIGDSITSTRHLITPLKIGTKDIYLNPGDLFKIFITGADESFYKANTTYFDADNDSSNNDKMLKDGRVRPINIDLIIRKKDGTTEYITKSILKNGLLNDVIFFGQPENNESGETNLSNEQALDQYRKAVNNGFSIYSGKSSGYLNFSVSLNTLEGFTVSHSYVQYQENNKIKYKLILKVFIPSRFKKTISYGSNKYLYLSDTKIKATLRGQEVNLTSIKKEDTNYETKIKKLLNIKNGDIPSSYKSDSLFEVLYIEDITKTGENNIFQYTIIPKSNIAYECFNAKKGVINLNNITDTPFKLNIWNYKSNIGTNYPLKLNFGYQGSLNEYLLNKIKEVKITFFDIYHNSPLGFGFTIPNNGNNFSDYTQFLPYYQVGSGGVLDIKTNIKEEKEALEEYYNTIKDKNINYDFLYLKEANYINIKNITNNNGLLKNNIYLCKIELIADNGDYLNKDFRFLHTSTIFDNEKIVDFNTLKPKKINLDNSDLLNDGEKGIKFSYNINKDKIYKSDLKVLNTYNKYDLNKKKALAHFIQEGDLDIDISLEINKYNIPFGEVDYSSYNTDITLEIGGNRKKLPSYTYEDTINNIINTNNNTLDLPNGDIIFLHSKYPPTVNNADISHRVNYFLYRKTNTNNINIKGSFKYLVNHVDLLNLEKTSIKNYTLIPINSSELFSQTEKFSTNGYTRVEVDYDGVSHSAEEFKVFNPYRYKELNKFLYSDMSSGVGYTDWSISKIFDNSPIQNSWGIFSKATGYNTEKVTIEMSSMLAGFALGTYSLKPPINNLKMTGSDYWLDLVSSNTSSDPETTPTGIRFKYDGLTDDTAGQGLFMHYPFGIKGIYKNNPTFEYNTLDNSFGYIDGQLYHAFSNLTPLVYHSYSNKIIVLNQLLLDPSILLNNFYKRSPYKTDQNINSIKNSKKENQDIDVFLKINNPSISLRTKNGFLLNSKYTLKNLISDLNTNNIEFSISSDFYCSFKIKDIYKKDLLEKDNSVIISNKSIYKDYFDNPISLDKMYVYISGDFVDLKDYSKYYIGKHASKYNYYVDYDEELDFIKFKTKTNPSENDKILLKNFLNSDYTYDSSSLMYMWTPLLFDYDGSLNIKIKDSIIKNTETSIINYSIYNNIKYNTNSLKTSYREQRFLFNNVPLYVPLKNNRLSIHPFAYSINQKKSNTDSTYSISINNRFPLLPYTSNMSFTGEEK